MSHETSPQPQSAQAANPLAPSVPHRVGAPYEQRRALLERRPATANTTEASTPDVQRVQVLKGLRYDQLLEYVARDPSLSILEIGVARGANALRMISFAQQRGGRPRYTGVDLFGSLDAEELASDYYVKTKHPMSVQQTMRMLRSELGVEAAMRIYLLEGKSQDVLPVLLAQRYAYDLIFIDGSHSYEGVKCDWMHCQHMLAPGGTIVFDDYPNWGIKPAVDEIDPALWNVRVLPAKDTFKHHNVESEVSSLRSHQLVEVTRR